MPRVLNEASVTITYQLQCGFERATALGDDLEKQLKDDKGLDGVKENTCGFDYHAVVDVTYTSLANAIRLDPIVRNLLSRRADFTYEARYGTSYSGRGPSLTVDSSTTLQPL